MQPVPAGMPTVQIIDEEAARVQADAAVAIAEIEAQERIADEQLYTERAQIEANTQIEVAKIAAVALSEGEQQAIREYVDAYVREHYEVHEQLNLRLAQLEQDNEKWKSLLNQIVEEESQAVETIEQPISSENKPVSRLKSAKLKGLRF